jgi:hypothetical protein
MLTKSSSVTFNHTSNERKREKTESLSHAAGLLATLIAAAYRMIEMNRKKTPYFPARKFVYAFTS